MNPKAFTLTFTALTLYFWALARYYGGSLPMWAVAIAAGIGLFAGYAFRRTK